MTGVQTCALPISAETAVRQALDRNSVLPLAYHAQGLVKRKRGDATALGDFERAVTLDPNFARGHAQVGNQKALSGNPKDSHADFAIARSLDPNHPCVGYFEWGEGRAFFAEKNWAPAIRLLALSVAALRTVWYNRLYLAAAQQNRGDAAGAVATLQKFIADPQFGDPQTGKAKVQSHIDRIPRPQPNPKNDPLIATVIAAHENLRRGLETALANV